MPVCRVKSGERPGESRERNTAIHHWIFPDIRGVIESDELMPDHLRINPKGHHRQTEKDDEIGSAECCSVAKRDDISSFRCRKREPFFFFVLFVWPSVAKLPETDNRNSSWSNQTFCATWFAVGSSQRIAAAIAVSTVSR